MHRPLESLAPPKNADVNLADTRTAGAVTHAALVVAVKELLAARFALQLCGRAPSAEAKRRMAVATKQFIAARDVATLVSVIEGRLNEAASDTASQWQVVQGRKLAA